MQFLHIAELGEMLLVLGEVFVALWHSVLLCRWDSGSLGTIKPQRSGVLPLAMTDA
jgi:hypothetical protein